MKTVIDIEKLHDAIHSLWTECGRLGFEYVLRDDVDRAIEEQDTIEMDEWIPIEGDDAELPDVDEDGYSELILLSFANCSLPTIGYYRVDEEGGAFYHEDVDKPLNAYGMFVNAWRYLPKPYEGV